MSHSCDEVCDVYLETYPKARKPHRCGACREVISPGSQYTKVAIVGAGSAHTYKRCARCQHLHEHLREKCRTSSEDLWPDEELNCGLDYEEEWGELPVEVAALAFAIPGELPEDTLGALLPKQENADT